MKVKNVSTLKAIKNSSDFKKNIYIQTFII